MLQPISCSRRPVSIGLLVTGLLILLAIALPGVLQAQTGGTGSIEGTVFDPAGSVVAGARVTATNTLTGVKTVDVTTGTGSFDIPLLLPGPYTVTVTAAGFETLAQENVIVDALAVVAVNPKLVVGAAIQSVTVTTEPSMLMTEDAKLGSDVDNEIYDALPLAMNGSARDPSAFAGLAVGVEGYSTQAAGPSTGSFNGGQTYENETYVEGLPLTSPGYGGGDTRSLAFGISVEAVEQFQVATAGTPATYEGQGVANYVVKSGTDKFHGGVYEYLRNTDFDAKAFFSPQLPTTVEHQNEFGGLIGGPVPFFKHKLFFFANYDGYRYDSATLPAFQNMPTAAEQMGDFSGLLAANGGPGYAIYDPLDCTSFNGSVCTGRAQFDYNGELNVIPPGRLSSVSKSFQSYLPKPTNGNLTSNYLATLPNLVNNDSGTLKVDYNLSDKHRLWGVFSRGRYINPTVGSLAAASQTSNSTLPTPYTDGRTVLEIATLAQIHETDTIKTNMVNDIAWDVSRLWIPLLSNTYGGAYPTKAGLTGLPAGVASSGFPDITFSGTNTVDYPVSWDGTNSHAFNEAATTFNVQDNFLWTKGRHQLTFGLQWQALQDNENTPLTGSQAGFTFAYQETANFNSSGALVTSSGADYASFLLGMVDSTSVVQNSVAETGGRFKTVAPYVQDNIQVTPKLTVNAGLRWDVWSPFTEVHNRMSFFDPNLANPAAGNIMGALQFAGRGIDSCGCRTPVATHYDNWAPRFGFAYSVNNKNVIRGSYGIFYAHAGGVAGHNSNSRQGLSQIGFDNSGSLTSVATGESALYSPPAAGTNPSSLTDGSWDNGYPGNPTAPPFINPSYGTGNLLSPGPIGSAANPMGLGPSSAQTLQYGDPQKGGIAPQYQDWTLNIQHSFSPNMTLSVAYAGTVGHHLPGAGVAGPFTDQIPLQYLPLGATLNSTLVNTATGVESASVLASVQDVFPGLLATLPFPNFVGTVAQALKPYPQYTSLGDPYLDVGNSEYHALQVSFNRRMSGGLTFMANYTLSKELDDLAGVRVPGADKLEWSVGAVDHKHVATGTVLYQLPFGTGHRLTSDNPVLRTVISGWQFAGIVQEDSGAPMSVTGSCTGYGIIDASCYPNYTTVGSVGSLAGVIWTGGSPWQNGKPSTAAAATSTHYLNGAAFINPTAATYGNAARTAPLDLFAPRTADTDLSVHRTFEIRESLKLSIQADAFNASNSVYFSAPNTTVGSASFGEFSAQANLPRKLQLSARLTF
jgi:carboxypeptidase family protein/TonB-dependent receptor-like protein